MSSFHAAIRLPPTSEVQPVHQPISPESQRSVLGRMVSLLRGPVCFGNRVHDPTLNDQSDLATPSTWTDPPKGQGISMTTRKRHIISLLLQNEVGALTRVASLFSTRGYNIESLNVAPTDDPTVSRLTLVTTGTDEVIQQIVNQSLKLIDVVNVDDVTRDQHVERELLLIKLGPRRPSSRRCRHACSEPAGGSCRTKRKALPSN